MPFVSTIKMTAKQYLELGEDPPGVRTELVNGEVAVGPSQTPDGSYVIVSLATLLGAHIEGESRGQLFAGVNVIFGEHEVRRPDVLFYEQHRLRLIGEKAIEGPPDLAVEVLSPSSIDIDRKDKFKLYAAGKVKYYWIVDPKQKTVEAYILKVGKYVGRVRGSGSDTVQLAPFGKLQIPLGKLWRPKR